MVFGQGVILGGGPCAENGHTGRGVRKVPAVKLHLVHEGPTKVRTNAT